MIDWINAKDRLPTRADDVLVAVRNPNHPDREAVTTGVCWYTEVGNRRWEIADRARRNVFPAVVFAWALMPDIPGVCELAAGKEDGDGR